MGGKAQLSREQKSRIKRHVMHHLDFYTSKSKRDNIFSEENRERLGLGKVNKKNKHIKMWIDSK